MDLRQGMENAQRIIVKVGTSTLYYPTGKLNIQRIETLVREIADLVNRGKEIILVSSGAVGAGMERMKLDKRPTDIPAKQALAAIGQGVLMHIYEKLFAELGQTVAQVLLTKENARRYSQYNHSRNALLQLLKFGVVPIINENDAVAVDELKIGDNDTLSAMVASLVDADTLIILSDIDGLYTANPSEDPNAQLIHQVNQITPEIINIAGGAGSEFGTGGMATKIIAAQIAVNSGANLIIASGTEKDVLHRLLDGEMLGTFFPAKESHLKRKKSWLAFGKPLAGRIVVDLGCYNAILKGSSILPVGIKQITGTFKAGSTVQIFNEEGMEIARGITNYNSSELSDLIGCKTLGKAHPEVVHRDNMVIMI